jgi:hypothetical protein
MSMINRLLIRILSNKVEHNGRLYLEAPTEGWKGNLFGRLVRKQIRRRDQNSAELPASELPKVLRHAATHLQKENKAFQIDISYEHEVEIQILHPYLMKEFTQDRNCFEFGFVVYWAFDPSANNNDQLMRFKALDISKEFVHQEFDDTIDCYALNCKMDFDKARMVVEQIMEEVRAYPKETKFRFDLSVLGALN